MIAVEAWSKIGDRGHLHSRLSQPCPKPLPDQSAFYTSTSARKVGLNGSLCRCAKALPKKVLSNAF